jgi:hypothetical protein
MISKTVTNEVADAIGKALRERFKDKFVFDPIIVEPAISHYGDEYLDVFIIFDGDQKKLDAHWTAGLTVLLGPKLDELGVDSVPVVSYVEKSEWEEVYHGEYPRMDELYRLG